MHKDKSAEPVPDFHFRTHSPEPLRKREHEEGVTDFSGLRIVGQLLHLYLLCERDEQLVVIDQHAAHERILYQQLRTAYEEKAIPRQSLMFPVPVEVTPEQSESLAKYRDDIEMLGISAEHFGEDTWVVKSVPAPVGNLEPAEILLEALEKLSSGSSRKAVPQEPRGFSLFVESALLVVGAVPPGCPPPGPEDRVPVASSTENAEEGAVVE